MKLNLRKSKLGILLGLMLVFLLAGTPALAFRFVVMGDTRGLKGQLGMEISRDCLGAIKENILKMNPRPDFVIVLGDLVMTAHDLNGREVLPDWISFMKPITTNPVEPGEIKLYVAIGNHELYKPDGKFAEGAEGIRLQDEFQTYFADMPSNGPPGYDKLTYTFEYGNNGEKSFFVVLDTYGYKPDGANWDNGLDEAQLDWLHNQAFGEAAQSARYRFALSHGPAFSPEGWGVDPSVQQTMWRILSEARFNAYYCSHDHLYSRWKPIGDLIQIITGAAGAWPNDPLQCKVDKAEANIYYGYNYCVVDVTPGKVKHYAYGLTQNKGKFSVTRIDRCTMPDAPADEKHGQSGQWPGSLSRAGGEAE